MISTHLERKFGEMGARVKIRTLTPNRLTRSVSGIPRLNVLKDKEGEYFDIIFPGNVENAEVQVLDVQVKDRHLLLMAKEGNPARPHDPPIKSKFLCGHDERHWFVAAIPEENTSVSNVVSAKQALQPREIQQLVSKAGLKPKKGLKRKNEVYKRQGEWFFIPAPNVEVEDKLIRKAEPLTRGRGSKPHMLEFAFRRGGTQVWTHPSHARTGISVADYANLPAEKRDGKWTSMTRDPELYVRGRVSHADHATIELDGWHRVMMNTEGLARSMKHVAFLD